MVGLVKRASLESSQFLSDGVLIDTFELELLYLVGRHELSENFVYANKRVDGTTCLNLVRAQGGQHCGLQDIFAVTESELGSL